MRTERKQLTDNGGAGDITSQQEPTEGLGTSKQQANGTADDAKLSLRRRNQEDT